MPCKTSARFDRLVFIPLLTAALISVPATTTGATAPNPLLLPAVAYNAGGAGTGSVVIADVNGDGIPDIVFTNAVGESDGDGSVGVMLGVGNGTFRPVVLYDSGGVDTGWLAVGDVNGDGIPDIVVTNQCGNGGCTSSSVGVLLGQGGGVFGPVALYSDVARQAEGLALGDLTGNGKLDIIVSDCGASPCLASTSGGAIEIMMGNGDGTFQSPTTPVSTGGAAYGVAVADVNQDGIPDLVVGTSGSYAEVFYGDGNGTFTGSFVPFPYGAVYPPIVADVNGDGVPDLLASDGAVVSVVLGKGAGEFEAAWSSYMNGNTPESLAVGDINGDGIPDVAAASIGSSIGIFFGNGNGTLRNPVNYPGGGAAWFLLPQAIAIADLNGDGKLDVVVANSNQNTIEVYINNRQGPPYTPTTTTLTTSADPIPSKQQVTYTATVTSLSGAPLTGTVMFYEAGAYAGTPISVQTLSGTQVSFGTMYKRNGSHAITAVYSGDAANSMSTSSSLLEAVGTSFGTHTKVTTSGSPSLDGRPVTFTADVTWEAGTVPDGGTVTFTNGATALGAATTASGVATLTTSILPTGDQVVSAAYSAAGPFKASQGSVRQVVEALPVASTTSLTTSGSPSLVDQAVTFTASVTSKYGTIPNGETVSYYDGATLIGTAPISSGVASLTTSSLAQGRHLIKATYAGDSTFKTSSARLSQVVDAD